MHFELDLENTKAFVFVFPQDTDEFILPTGANKTRGRFELAFFTIGGCCMTGKWLWILLFLVVQVTPLCYSDCKCLVLQDNVCSSLK